MRRDETRRALAAAVRNSRSAAWGEPMARRLLRWGFRTPEVQNLELGPPVRRSRTKRTSIPSEAASPTLAKNARIDWIRAKAREKFVFADPGERIVTALSVASK